MDEVLQWYMWVWRERKGERGEGGTDTPTQRTKVLRRACSGDKATISPSLFLYRNSPMFTGGSTIKGKSHPKMLQCTEKKGG